MNVLSEQRNEVMKSLAKGIRWEMLRESIVWSEQEMDGQVVHLCVSRTQIVCLIQQSRQTRRCSLFM